MLRLELGICMLVSLSVMVCLNGRVPRDYETIVPRTCSYLEDTGTWSVHLLGFSVVWPSCNRTEAVVMDGLATIAFASRNYVGLF